DLARCIFHQYAISRQLFIQGAIAGVVGAAHPGFTGLATGKHDKLAIYFPGQSTNPVLGELHFECHTALTISRGRVQLRTERLPIAQNVESPRRQYEASLFNKARHVGILWLWL